MAKQTRLRQRRPRTLDTLPAPIVPTNALLARPRIIALLRAALTRGHVLLSAPGGYGKTAALKLFAVQQPQAHYLALSLADTDVAYLAARVTPLLTPHATLLLDDAQWLIDAPDAWEWLVSRLASRQPRWILSGRAFPLLGGVPADGIVQLDAASLAFTPQETRALLELRGVPQPDADTPQYVRAAGWALALDLMTRHSTQHSHFEPREGTGLSLIAQAARPLLDALPSELYEFMRATAQPLRFSDELAAMLLSLTIERARDLRLGVQQRNLFLEPLDSPGWFRYHELIRDVLRADAPSDKGKAIASWFREREDWEMAIEHALDNKLYSLAAEWLADVPLEFIKNNGRQRTYRRWVLALAPEVRAVNPILFERLAYHLLDISLHAQALEYLEFGQQYAAQSGDLAAQHLLELALAKAHNLGGAPRRAVSLCRAVLANAPEPQIQRRAYNTLGNAHVQLGETSAARRAYYDALASPPAVGALSDPYIRGNLVTVILTPLGDFESAERLLQENDAYFSDKPVARGLHLLGWCGIHEALGEWDALAKDLNAIDEAEALAEQFDEGNVWTEWWRLLLEIGRGDFPAAHRLVEQLSTLITTNQEELTCLALAHVWLLRRQGKYAAAVELGNNALAQHWESPVYRAVLALERDLAHYFLDGTMPYPDSPSLGLARYRTRHHLVRLRALLALACARSGDSRWRRHAQSVLAALNRPRYARLLTFRDPELGAAFWALCVEKNFGTPTAQAALQIMGTVEPVAAQLKHAEAAVRERAAHTLERMCNENALPHLDRAIEIETERAARQAMLKARAVLEAMPPPRLVVKLMGDMQVWSEGALLREDVWHRPIVRRLFQFFALHRGKSFARDEILDALWGEADAPNAAGTFRTVFSRLRNALEPHLRAKAPSRYFAVEGDVYRFDPADRVQVDVEQFTATLRLALNDAAAQDVTHLSEELIAALKNYQPLLPELPLQEWLIEPRERLNTLYVEGCLHLAQTFLLYHRYAGALEWANKTVTAAPWAEEAYQVLMRAHAGLGSRSLALKAYQQAVTALARELDLKPSPLTEWLAERLRAGDEI